MNEDEFPDHDHDDHPGYCVLCDGTDDERKAAAEILAEHLRPRIEAADRAMAAGEIVIPHGLSRDQRRQFLRDNPQGILVLDRMSDAEFDDWLADDFEADHGSVSMKGLSREKMRRFLRGR